MSSFVCDPIEIKPEPAKYEPSKEIELYIFKFDPGNELASRIYWIDVCATFRDISLWVLQFDSIAFFQNTCCIDPLI